MGLRNIDLWFPEEWEVSRDNRIHAEKQTALKKWKTRQPKYIAVEMTNHEILNAFESGKIITFNCQIVFEGGADKYKIIKGRLYKKVLNQKIKGRKIIKWDR